MNLRCKEDRGFKKEEKKKGTNKLRPTEADVARLGGKDEQLARALGIERQVVQRGLQPGEHFRQQLLVAHQLREDLVVKREIACGMREKTRQKERKTSGGRGKNKN